MSEFSTTQAAPMEGIPQKCAGLMNCLTTWKGVLLLLLLIKGTHLFTLILPKNSKNKDRRCQAGKTKIVLSGFAFFSFLGAFVFALFSKDMPKRNLILTSITALGSFLGFLSLFFD